LLSNSKDKRDVAHILLKVKTLVRKDVFCILNKDTSKSERRDRKSEGKRDARKKACLTGSGRQSPPEWAARGAINSIARIQVSASYFVLGM
jgi:hypothetical protein